MPKIVKEHKCETCDEKSYFVRLAEPQPVRVEDRSRPYMALAKYAVINISEYRHPEAPTLEQVSVMIADEEGKSYPGVIYAYNRGRSLAEVLWTIGGEYDDTVDMNKEVFDGTR